MNDPAPQSRISIRLYDERGILRILVAYLFQTPDGAKWALPDPPSHATNPDLHTAYKLDPSLIEEVPSNDEDERLYLYREVWHAPPE
jgi:hypothetical protein